MKLLNSIKIAIMTALFGAVVFVTPVAAMTAPSPAYLAAGTSKQIACKGAGLTDEECNGSGSSSVETLLRNVVQLLSVIVGIAGIIMVIISGFKYITSGGDAGKVSSAKSTLIYALVGLVVAALAQVLVHFVLSKT